MTVDIQHAIQAERRAAVDEIVSRRAQIDRAVDEYRLEAERRKDVLRAEIAELEEHIASLRATLSSLLQMLA